MDVTMITFVVTTQSHRALPPADQGKLNRGGAVGFQTARAPRSPTRTIQINATSAAAIKSTGSTIRTIADCLPALALSAVLLRTTNTLSKPITAKRS